MPCQRCHPDCMSLLTCSPSRSSIRQKLHVSRCSTLRQKLHVSRCSTLRQKLHVSRCSTLRAVAKLFRARKSNQC